MSRPDVAWGEDVWEPWSFRFRRDGDPFVAVDVADVVVVAVGVVVDVVVVDVVVAVAAVLSSSSPIAEHCHFARIH